MYRSQQCGSNQGFGVHSRCLAPFYWLALIGVSDRVAMSAAQRLPRDWGGYSPRRYSRASWRYRRSDRATDGNRTNRRGGRQFDAHHNPSMPETRVLKDHHITWRGDAALSRRSRGLGDLHPSWLPRIACPQVKSIGRHGHRIDLGVGPAHKAHVLVGTVGPGRAARTDLRAILDHGLPESGHAWWVIGTGGFVSGVVAVWIADASATGGTHVEGIGHGSRPGHDLRADLAGWHAGGCVSARRGWNDGPSGTRPRCDRLADTSTAPVSAALHPGEGGCNAGKRQKRQQSDDDDTASDSGQGLARAIHQVSLPYPIPGYSSASRRGATSATNPAVPSAAPATALEASSMGRRAKRCTMPGMRRTR